MYESNDKMVSHPDHYQSKNGLEVIQVIEAFTEGLNGIEAVDTANAIKYVCRWKKKNGVQDLKKAVWYLQHLIHHLDGDSTWKMNRNDLVSKVAVTADGPKITVKKEEKVNE